MKNKGEGKMKGMKKDERKKNTRENVIIKKIE